MWLLAELAHPVWEVHNPFLFYKTKVRGTGWSITKILSNIPVVTFRCKWTLVLEETREYKMYLNSFEILQLWHICMTQFWLSSLFDYLTQLTLLLCSDCQRGIVCCLFTSKCIDIWIGDTVLASVRCNTRIKVIYPVI